MKEELFNVQFVFDYAVVTVPVVIDSDNFPYLQDSEEEHIEEELEQIALNEAVSWLLHEGLEIPYENSRIEIERG
jgi:hypothetical protein